MTNAELYQKLSENIDVIGQKEEVIQEMKIEIQMLRNNEKEVQNLNKRIEELEVCNNLLRDV